MRNKLDSSKDHNLGFKVYRK